MATGDRGRARTTASAKALQTCGSGVLRTPRSIPRDAAAIAWWGPNRTTAARWGGGRADLTTRSLPAETSARESEYQRDQEQNQGDEKHDLRHPDRSSGNPAEAQHGRDQRDDQQSDNQAQHGRTSLTRLPRDNSQRTKTFLDRCRSSWKARQILRFWVTMRPA